MAEGGYEGPGGRRGVVEGRIGRRVSEEVSVSWGGGHIVSVWDEKSAEKKGRCTMSSSVVFSIGLDLLDVVRAHMLFV